MDKWEECQELVEHIFGSKPESPDDLVGIMIYMADTIADLREGRESDKNEKNDSRNLHFS